MPSHQEGSSERERIAAWDRLLKKLGSLEGRRAGARPEETEEAVQAAWELFLLKARSGAPQPGSRPVGASERLVLRNLLREFRRARFRWRRHNGPWCPAAEESAVAAPVLEPEDDLPQLARPLHDVARLLRGGYATDDIAGILSVDPAEVTRRAAWILLRRSELGAALPQHLGMEARSLGCLPRPLRQEVLRALHAVRWPRVLMASELCISVRALGKALERGGLVEQRG